MNDEWRKRAICLGRDPTLWYTELLPSREPQRTMVAQSRCSGCPVKLECGRDVLIHRDVGIVRCGIALEDVGGPELFAQYDAIREMLGIPRPTNGTVVTSGHIAWPRECIYCGKTMRPPKELAELWPGTVSSYSKNACRVCMRKLARRRDAFGHRVSHGYRREDEYG